MWILRISSCCSQLPQVQEANHSVTVTLKRIPSAMMPPPGYRFQTETRMMLLHPVDVLKAKELVLRTSTHNSHQQVEAVNFILSKELDDYCHNGKYYIRTGMTLLQNKKSIGILVALGYQVRSDPLLLRAYRNCCSSLH